MKIGLDFDGVITDCSKLKVYGAKKLFGLDIPAEKFKKEILIREKILTLDQYLELQNVIYGNREIGLTMEAVDGLFEYLPKLCKNHSIKIVTSRLGNNLDIAKEWLYLNKINVECVGVGKNNNKIEETKGMDVFIDDDLDKLIPLIGSVPNLFLFSWDYNKDMDIGTIIKRKNSWLDIYQSINALT